MIVPLLLGWVWRPLLLWGWVYRRLLLLHVLTALRWVLHWGVILTLWLLPQIVGLLWGGASLLLRHLPRVLSRALVLLFPSSLLVQNESALFHLFCHYPPFPRTASVGKGFMLCFHARTFIIVCVVSLNVWEMETFLARGGAIVAGMIDIIAA